MTWLCHSHPHITPFLGQKSLNLQSAVVHAVVHATIHVSNWWKYVSCVLGRHVVKSGTWKPSVCMVIAYIPPGVLWLHWGIQCNKFCVGNISNFLPPKNILGRWARNLSARVQFPPTAACDRALSFPSPYKSIPWSEKSKPWVYRSTRSSTLKKTCVKLVEIHVLFAGQTCS